MLYKYGNPEMKWDNIITCRGCGARKYIGINEGMDNLERLDLIVYEQNRARCCPHPDYAMYPPEDKKKITQKEKAEQISKAIFAGFIKEMQKETDYDDDYKLGYAEAILNLAGEFSNGQCEDCPFSHEVECPCYDFTIPEIDLRCGLKECWIERIKKLIYKEQEKLRKITELNDEILDKAYTEIISAGGYNKARFGRVAMDELYKYIRKNYVKKLTLTQFKEFMSNFYDKYPLGDFGFERASGIHPEVMRYGFFKSTKPAGMYFYIHKGMCTK